MCVHTMIDIIGIYFNISCIACADILTLERVYLGIYLHLIGVKSSIGNCSIEYLFS